MSSSDGVRISGAHGTAAFHKSAPPVDRHTVRDPAFLKMKALTDSTDTDGRYILACPQAAGKKTVQFSISRPASLTAFGAEWVQLFPKDSWSNTTNECLPF